MTTAYKLTNQFGKSHSETQWGENVTHTTNGGGELCGAGWLHYYEHPLLAVLLNPVHADFWPARLWECRPEGSIKHDRGLKSGCTQLTTLREIPLPEVTPEQRVRFAIFCALAVNRSPAFVAWAEKWVSGADRTGESAEWAAVSVKRAAEAAESAIGASEWAAISATESAEFAGVGSTATAACVAAQAAEWATEGIAAAAAAEWAVASSSTFFSLAALAERAMLPTI